MARRIRESGKLRGLCGTALLTVLSTTVPVVVTATTAQALQGDSATSRPDAVITWNLHARTAIHEVASSRRPHPLAASR